MRTVTFLHSVLASALVLPSLASAQACGTPASMSRLYPRTSSPLNARCAVGGWSTAPNNPFGLPILGDTTFNLSISIPYCGSTPCCGLSTGSAFVALGLPLQVPVIVPGVYGCVVSQFPGDLYLFPVFQTLAFNPSTRLVPVPIPSSLALCGAALGAQAVFFRSASASVHLGEGIVLTLGV